MQREKKGDGRLSGLYRWLNLHNHVNSPHLNTFLLRFRRNHWASTGVQNKIWRSRIMIEQINTNEVVQNAIAMLSSPSSCISPSLSPALTRLPAPQVPLNAELMLLNCSFSGTEWEGPVPPLTTVQVVRLDNPLRVLGDARTFDLKKIE